MDIFGDPEMNLMMYGDERPRARLKGKMTDQYGEEAVVGVSVPVDATDEEKKNILESIQKSLNEASAFERLPREEKLEHYLNIAVQALYKIMNSSQSPVTDMTGDLWQHDVFKERVFQLSGICCVADMALIQIPNSVRGDIDTNARIKT